MKLAAPRPPSGQEFGELFGHVLVGSIPQQSMTYHNTHEKIKDRTLSGLQEMVDQYGPPDSVEMPDISQGRRDELYTVKEQTD